ncbi:MAG: KH domain-containing protein [Bacilli bacterium]|jgi:uncharacterized protein
MNYQELVHTIIDPIITKPEAVLIREQPSTNEKDVTLLIVAENEDTARLIGKKGVVANAIRDVISVSGKLEGIHVHLKFESFDQEDKEKKE